MPNSLLYAICTLIWGSTWLAITFQFGVVTPTASVGYRFLIAGCAMLAWCAARRLPLRLRAQDVRWITLQGMLMFGFSYMLVYAAETRIASGLVAVLNASMVAFNLIGARIAFGRAIDRKSASGATLGMIGIVVVYWPVLTGAHTDADWLGAALGLLAALIASLGNLTAQRNRAANLPLLPTIGYGMLIGGAASLLGTVVVTGHLAFDFRPAYLLSLAYLAIFGSVIAFACYLTLLGRIGAAKSGYVAVAVPLIALMLSARFEHFSWHLSTAFGMASAIVGNIIMLADLGPLRTRSMTLSGVQTNKH